MKINIPKKLENEFIGLLELGIDSAEEGILLNKTELTENEKKVLEIARKIVNDYDRQ